MKTLYQVVSNNIVWAITYDRREAERYALTLAKTQPQEHIEVKVTTLERMCGWR